jgi:hypothetical protein
MPTEADEAEVHTAEKTADEADAKANEADAKANTTNKLDELAVSKAGLKAMLWPVAANVLYGADASNSAWVDMADDKDENNYGKFDFYQTMTSSSFQLFALS